MTWGVISQQIFLSSHASLAASAINGVIQIRGSSFDVGRVANLRPITMASHGTQTLDHFEQEADAVNRSHFVYAADVHLGWADLPTTAAWSPRPLPREPEVPGQETRRGP